VGSLSLLLLRFVLFSGLFFNVVVANERWSGASGRCGLLGLLCLCSGPTV
jgi:hypothetical protein